MYVIVEFLEDNTCDKAPITWLVNDTECRWPSSAKGDDINMLIKNMAAPKPDWGSYKIRKLGVAATYGEACMKAKKAEEDSDLSASDVENYGRGMRGQKRRFSQIVRHDDSDEESIVFDKSFDNILQSLPIPPDPQNMQPHCSRDNRPESRIKERVHSFNDNFEERTSSQSSTFNNRPCFIQPQIMKERTKSCNEMQSTPVAPKNNSVLKNVCRDLAVIKHNQGRILDLLGILLERNPNTSSQHMPSEPKLVQVFPVKSEAEMDDLEASVADATCENELLMKWKTFGGSSCGDHTRRILKDLMTDALAERYSWLGHKEKRRFSSLKVSQIIIDAVVQTNKNNTRAEVEKLIKDWLRHAKERKEYKSKTKKSNTNETA